MILRTSKWLDLTDDDFLKDTSIDTNCQKKIQKLKRTRLSFLATIFISSVMFIGVFVIELLRLF